MDLIYLLLSLIPLALAVGAILGWVSFRKTRALEARLDHLQKQFWRLREDQLYGARLPARPDTERPQAPEPEPRVAVQAPTNRDEPPPKIAQPAPRDDAKVAAGPSLGQRLREHWMIWLGGISIGLAGIFMVRYSIDQGLLGPAGRIVLALFTGLVFHGAAEYLRRRQGSQPAFAALAGGASITLYAALLAALHLYQLLSPTLTFMLLAAVSVATMALALVHGPVLAIIGILGAYVVPVLVSTGSGNIVAALIYSLIISAAALLLMRYVYRPWLWAGMLAGALGWALLSLDMARADAFRGIYLALLAYAIVAIPRFDWTLRLAQPLPESAESWFKRLNERSLRPLQIGLALTVLLLGLSMIAQPFSGAGYAAHLPAVAVLFLLSRYREPLQWLPWLSLVVVLGASLASGLSAGWELVALDAAQRSAFIYFALAATLLYSLLALWNLGLGRFPHLWASLMALAPVLWLGLLYLRVPAVAASWQWAVGSLMLGGVYVFIAGSRLQRRAHDTVSLWLLLAGHGGYSLAAAMAFREAGLTLALAAQLISLAWLMQRFNLPALGWLIKLVIGVVVTRLTLNPWLLSYPADVHWSLWTYGGSTLCCFIATSWLKREDALKPWLEAAGLHLLVLFLAAETRYWLYDGNVFASRYGFTEAALNTNLWAALALVYFYRARFTQHLVKVYIPAARILMCLSLGSYALLLTSLNPYFAAYEVVDARPVFNGLLLAYGLPVVLAALAGRYYEPRFRRFAAVVAGGGLLVFVNLEIRHLWNGTVSEFVPTGNGELYTYSLVWLVMAAVAIVLGTQRQWPALYKAGMGLLLVVVGKIFLVDMSDLEGLLRVASFMVLGLSLLGLSYLHRQLTPTNAE